MEWPGMLQFQHELDMVLHVADNGTEIASLTAVNPSGFSLLSESSTVF